MDSCSARPLLHPPLVDACLWISLPPGCSSVTEKHALLVRALVTELAIKQYLISLP